LADVRFGAHYGLKSDIAPGPKVPITESRAAANGIVNHLVSTQQEGLGNVGRLPSRSPGVIEAGDREVTGFQRISLTSGKVANRRH
jgi:hypothetical protein